MVVERGFLWGVTMADLRVLRGHCSYLILYRPPVKEMCIDALEDLWMNCKSGTNSLPRSRLVHASLEHCIGWSLLPPSHRIFPHLSLSTIVHEKERNI